MSTPHYQIIRRPIITEKGLGVKETQHTVVFEVAAKATKTEIKEAVQRIFKVKVSARAHRELSRQDSPPRPRGRFSPRLEESLREAGRRRKDDRVRGESVIAKSLRQRARDVRQLRDTQSKR